VRLTETKFPETDNKKPKRKTNTHTEFNRTKNLPGYHHHHHHHYSINNFLLPASFPLQYSQYGSFEVHGVTKSTIPEQRLLGKSQAALLRILCRWASSLCARNSTRNCTLSATLALLSILLLSPLSLSPSLPLRPFLRSREARRCVTAAAVTEHVLHWATAAVRDRGGSNRIGRTSAWFLP